MKLRITQKFFFLNKFENGKIMRKGFDLLEIFFFVLCRQTDRFYRKHFSTSNWATYSKIKLFWCFEAFLQILMKNSLLGHKSD